MHLLHKRIATQRFKNDTKLAVHVEMHVNLLPHDVTGWHVRQENWLAYTLCNSVVVLTSLPTSDR